MSASTMDRPELSVVIVSFNTRDLLRECLQCLYQKAGHVSFETIVVDSASKDGSADMVAEEFPEIILIRSELNLGFGGANNRAFEVARGKYLVLLNSDAFIAEGGLQGAFEHMEAEAKAGAGGARLRGRDGEDQPSGRGFPSLWGDFCIQSGLAARYGNHSLFGRINRSGKDPSQAATVDWITGAFMILRKELIDLIHGFDEAFFLYSEEVDLCRRIRAQGYAIHYWPDLEVIHYGGESSKTIEGQVFSGSSAQLEGWRLRSNYLYYRKHHGCQAWWSYRIESIWHSLRLMKNRLSRNPGAALKAEASRIVLGLLRQAWIDTKGGRTSPPRPW